MKSVKPASKITPCLWFDDQAEEAAKFYVSIFKNSRIVTVSYYTEVGREHHGREPGSVLMVAFELDGQSFTALNGGPIFKFTEAISLQVACETQQEVDYYWSKLLTGGDAHEQECGWLKDKYGLSWQIVPNVLMAMISDPNVEKAKRATQAMFTMKKLDIAALERAYEG